MDPSQLPGWAAIKVVTVSLGRSFMHPWAERKLMKRINAARLGIGNSFLLLTDEQQPATTTRYIQYICVQEQQPFPQHFPHCYHFHLRPFIWKWDTQWLRMGSDYHLTVCIVFPSSSLCSLCVCACACVTFSTKTQYKQIPRPKAEAEQASTPIQWQSLNLRQ